MTSTTASFGFSSNEPARPSSARSTDAVRRVPLAEGLLDRERRQPHAERPGDRRGRQRRRLAGGPLVVESSCLRTSRLRTRRSRSQPNDPSPSNRCRASPSRHRRLDAGVDAPLRVPARRGRFAPARARRATPPSGRLAHVPGARDRPRRQDGSEPGDVHLDDRPRRAGDDDRRAVGDDDEHDRDAHVLGERARLDLRVPARYWRLPACVSPRDLRLTAGRTRSASAPSTRPATPTASATASWTANVSAAPPGRSRSTPVADSWMLQSDAGEEQRQRLGR